MNITCQKANIDKIVFATFLFSQMQHLSVTSMTTSIHASYKQI